MSKPTTLNKAVWVDTRIVNSKVHTSCGCGEVQLLDNVIKGLESYIEDLEARVYEAECTILEMGVKY